MNIKEVSEALKDRRLHMVAAATGLHVNTIREIRDGLTTDPKTSTLNKLVEYLRGSNNNEA